jgi:hypothetical protein
VDLDDFETWLDDPQQRRDALHADLDAIAETLSAFDADVERLEDGELDGSDTDSDATSESGLTWVDATYRSRVVGLLLDDVREEHADLREWEMDDSPDPDASLASDPTLADRLHSLQSELEDLDDRLSTVATPEWHEHFDANVAHFEEALEAIDEPIDWAEVQSMLETHRKRIEAPR